MNFKFNKHWLHSTHPQVTGTDFLLSHSSLLSLTFFLLYVRSYHNIVYSARSFGCIEVNLRSMLACLIPYYRLKITYFVTAINKSYSISLIHSFKWVYCMNEFFYFLHSYFFFVTSLIFCITNWGTRVCLTGSCYLFLLKLNWVFEFFDNFFKKFLMKRFKHKLSNRLTWSRFSLNWTNFNSKIIFLDFHKNITKNVVKWPFEVSFDSPNN